MKMTGTVEAVAQHGIKPSLSCGADERIVLESDVQVVSKPTRLEELVIEFHLLQMVNPTMALPQILEQTLDPHWSR